MGFGRIRTHNDWGFDRNLPAVRYAAQNSGYGIHYPRQYRDYNVPRVHAPNTKVVVKGGNKGAGTSYRYKYGYDHTTDHGSRVYDHKSGYGWSKGDWSH